MVHKKRSPREIRQQQEAQAQEQATPVVLYYGSKQENDEIRCEVYGKRYVIPADSDGIDPKTGESITRDGTLLILPVQGGKKWYRPKKGQAWPTERKTMFTAAKIAAAIVSARQDQGVVALTGDPRTDHELKNQATTTWVLWRRVSAQKTVTSYNRQNKEQVNAGGGPAEMTERVMLAQRFVEDSQAGKYNKYIAGGTKFKYRCKETDCNRFETSVEHFVSHLQIAHKLNEAQINERYVEIDGDPPPPPVPGLPPRRKPGRPSNAERAAREAQQPTA